MSDRKGVFVYLDSELHEKLKALADSQERSMSWVVKDAIRKALDPPVDHASKVGFGNDFPPEPKPPEPKKRKSRGSASCSHPMAFRSEGRCQRNRGGCGAMV